MEIQIQTQLNLPLMFRCCYTCGDTPHRDQLGKIWYFRCTVYTELVRKSNIKVRNLYPFDFDSSVTVSRGHYGNVTIEINVIR